MASSPGGGAATAKNPRVLLPFTCDTLRIPDELAAEIGAGEALVVGPSASKVKPWRVEVGWDGDGAFLGRGWPEFADACGVDLGWLLVLRHRGRALLTVKAFDASSCLREFVAQPPAAAVQATASGQGIHKLQFVRVLPTDFMQKMLIPAKFVQQYIPKEHLNKNNHTAIVFGPCGKVSHIEMEMNQSDVFFSGGWSQFLVFHEITESNALLLRYEGNMVFTVKVFGPDGCQRESKGKDIRMQQNIEEQEAPSISIQKHYKNDCSNSDGEKKPKGPMTHLSKAPLSTKSAFEIGPPSWIKKQINANTLNELALQTGFCDAIGLQEPCIITLKTSMSSTESWQVHAHLRDGSYRIRQGWSRFCKESNLKLGDICTIDIVKTTLWLVGVTRCKEKMNELCNLEKAKRKKDRSSGRGQKRPRSSISRVGCVFEIGPPAWMKKEINTSTITKHLSLPLSLCKAVGLREPYTITLKTLASSTNSWQARLHPHKNGNQMYGSGRLRFCRENRIKVGDVCTIKIIETTLWHVIIEHR